MKIGIVAPSPVPFVIGGAEKLWWGLTHHINQHTPHQAELIKLPSPENTFPDLMRSYSTFSRLDLNHFDTVISTKYPAWMVRHPNHICYIQHKLRGLYDTYPLAETDPDWSHPELRHLRRMLEGQTDHLDELCAEAARLSEAPETAPYLRFPGPLTRRIVHYLDHAALHPSRIRKYAAISRNVAQRKDYFPAEATVQVIHHPTDLEGLSSTGYAYMFTASRFVAPKRIDLLVKAFRRTSVDVQLRIAGTGPEEARLRALAGDDPRIRFEGFVNDEQLRELYAGALCVPYFPYDEDYGLITVEAMQSGKAVLTTTDAGGVNELLQHGHNGLCVAPEEHTLASAITELATHPETTLAMGHNARDSVRHIDWAHTVSQLLQNPAPTASGKRRRIVVTTTFPVYPPVGGGQRRVFHLCREMAREAEVVLVTLCDGQQDGTTHHIAPNFWEHCLPKSAQHIASQRAMEKSARASVADIAAIENYGLTPTYLEKLAKAAENADLVVASHPYLFDAIREVYQGPVWYDAHNVEADMKANVLQNCPSPESLLKLVRRVEHDCLKDSERVLACSAEDVQRFKEIYQINKIRTELIPNGVDTSAIPFSTPAQRREAKRRLGLDQDHIAFFMGSWHAPNIDAVRHIQELAHQMPETLFCIIGSVCRHSCCTETARNIKPLGLVSEGEKSVLLGAADVALNPITSGAGTNLKILEYAAAGVPIVTTPFGARGTAFDEHHLVMAEVADFAEGIQRIRGMSEEELEAMLRQAREVVASQWDWEVVGQRLRRLLPFADSSEAEPEKCSPGETRQG